jgi:hypothetical protein
MRSVNTSPHTWMGQIKTNSFLLFGSTLTLRMKICELYLSKL